MKGLINKKWVVLVLILAIFIGLYINVCHSNAISVEAKCGVIDLLDWNFEKDGIIHLDGRWELYFNELLEPDKLKNRRPDGYFHIPGTLGAQLAGKTTGYMTLHLKMMVPDDIVYGLRINNRLSASKVWVNGVFQGSHGKIGKSFAEERAIYLPVYAFFTSENEKVDIVIQASNFRDIQPIIYSIDFGLKKQIMGVYTLSIIMDTLIIGALLMIELCYLAIYFLRRKERTFLYFAVLCFLIQLRCLVLNERILVQFYPEMPYELMSKIAAITYYLWVMMYVLFLKEQFEDFSKRMTDFAVLFGSIFTGICVVTINTFYDRLAIYGHVFLIIIILYLLVFLIRKSRERDINGRVSLMALLVLAITGINDVLINNGVFSNVYVFQIGMFIFAFLESYMLAINFSTGFTRLEELSLENQSIYEKSIRDGLTNLYNHKYIEQILSSSIDRYNELNEIFTVLMIDIDYFKAINDEYGHPFGDRVLIGISHMFKKSLRATDYVGRYGGEEFLIILPNTNKVEAREIAERIRSNIGNFTWFNGKLHITISIGLYENQVNTKEECVKHVDQLLYLAKDKGRNRVEEA